MSKYYLCQISAPEITFKAVLSSNQLEDQGKTVSNFDLPEDTKITVLRKVIQNRFFNSSLVKLVP
ncbi:hypothetical protein [Litoribrevibacter albus]|uniref:Uncharacterized protein n=1 Tax=Litoribrevibacter albus TaxID=1473156 RepID=A0AA37S9T2_9GAMM|nr:hypothetical protein [Litoribrevibacter albus]GLQ31088.1 hypothetical protein GCM10007876_15670 [Litoribrevibacter albus]